MRVLLLCSITLSYARLLSAFRLHWRNNSDLRECVAMYGCVLHCLIDPVYRYHR
jgi:hypothetical protein